MYVHVRWITVGHNETGCIQLYIKILRQIFDQNISIQLKGRRTKMVLLAERSAKGQTPPLIP